MPKYARVAAQRGNRNDGDEISQDGQGHLIAARRHKSGADVAVIAVPQSVVKLLCKAKHQ